MTSFQTVKSMVESRYLELKNCGANSPGGGGFRAGNTCARGGKSSSNAADKDVGVHNASPEETGLTYISELTDKVPFVGDTKVTEVFGAADKADKDWRYLISTPIEKSVDVSNLRSLQPGVNKSTVEQYRAHFKQGGRRPTPYVIEHKGKYYLKNGTHTSVAQVLNGASKIKVAVLVKTEDA